MSPLERIGRWFAATPALALVVALALIAASFALGVYNERLGAIEREHQATVQAQILAGSVAAPLAFDDTAATTEYVAALRANPAVEAAGAYDQHGRYVAGFVRIGPGPPPRNQAGPPVLDATHLVVTAPVLQGQTRLGSVYLRVSTGSQLRRVMRYVGIGFLIVMAALLLAVLGASNAAVSEAHRKLQAEILVRERAEEALRQSQKMEAMGQLTGGVAHDFNNLLMVASSGLDLMERTSDPERQRRLKDGIRQAIDRGASLTQQLLAFARRSPLHPEVIDLAAGLRNMHDLLDRSLREDIEVDMSAVTGVWPVEVDPSQLEVAILNIALNARDAMPNGGVITITLEDLPAGPGASQDRIRLAIVDQGVGMAPELVARVFEPFFTTKGVGQGTGLGLSQVYGFARASGGDIELQSEVGGGTTVSLLLPRSSKPIPGAKAKSPATSADEHGGRVLMVEDDDHVAGLVGEMLGELGYDVIRVATPAAALQALDTEPRIDLVFSDMVMPGDMDGLDLARQIRGQRPALPIVLTTGYSAAAAAAAAEGLQLLVKPYGIDALAAELHTALASPRSPELS
jgi:signal transduction histidine kinase/CheY-like chemotaxis protein